MANYNVKVSVSSKGGDKEAYRNVLWLEAVPRNKGTAL
jgi:hypothetical protein